MVCGSAYHLWNNRCQSLDLQRRINGKRCRKRKRKGKECFNQSELNLEKPLKGVYMEKLQELLFLTMDNLDLKLMNQRNGKQIEAARVALTRYMKRTGKVWTRIFPNIPVSKKPTEVRMGKGKGSPEYYACRVKPGRIIFEIDGVSEEVAREALYKASAKLPIKTKFIKR